MKSFRFSHSRAQANMTSHSIQSAWVALLVACLFLSSSLEAARPPNIVLMVADDLGFAELGCYGQQKIRTPNIDRLAAEGRRFTRHDSGAPTCAPSRCVLLTGRHLGHADIRANRQATDAAGKAIEGQHPMAATTRTLAEVLRDHGYATAAFGKWGLGRPDSPGAPARHGFDLFLGYNCQAQAHSYYPPHLWRNDEMFPFNAHPVPGHVRRTQGVVAKSDWAGERRAPEYMVDEALAFMRRQRGGPFFLYLPFIEPHVALQPPPDLVETYPADWDDRPYLGQCGYTPHPRPRAAYAALVTALDRHVGRIMAGLDALGLRQDTLVVFTSDNGTTHDAAADPVLGVGGVDARFFGSTAGLRGRKGSVYEGGLRVPLIVRWPGRVPAGTTSTNPTYFADHFPTLCEAAGLAVPEGLDGTSQWPDWRGLAPRPRRVPMTWVFAEYGGQVALRDGALKLVRTNLMAKGGPGPWELYDLESDPGEERDLAGRRPGDVRRLVELLARENAENATFPVSLGK